MSDVPLPSWLFSWKNTHTYIYIYPLVSSWKIESFHVAKNFLGLGKGTLSRSLNRTLLHLAGGATRQRMRFQAHWEPQALCPELGVAACYRRHGFWQRFDGSGKSWIVKPSFGVVLICSKIRWLNCYVVISLKKIPRNWVNWTTWVETT